MKNKRRRRSDFETKKLVGRHQDRGLKQTKDKSRTDDDSPEIRSLSWVLQIAGAEELTAVQVEMLAARAQELAHVVLQNRDGRIVNFTSQR